MEKHDKMRGQGLVLMAASFFSAMLSSSVTNMGVSIWFTFAAMGAGILGAVLFIVGTVEWYDAEAKKNGRK